MENMKMIEFNYEKVVKDYKYMKNIEENRQTDGEFNNGKLRAAEKQ